MPTTIARPNVLKRILRFKQPTAVITPARVNYTQVRQYLRTLADAFCVSARIGVTPKFTKGAKVLIQPIHRRDTFPGTGWELLDLGFFKQEESATVISSDTNTDYIHEIITEDRYFWRWYDNNVPAECGAARPTSHYTLDNLRTGIAAYLKYKQDQYGVPTLAYVSYRLAYDNPSITIRYSMAEVFMDAYADRDMGAGI